MNIIPMTRARALKIMDNCADKSAYWDDWGPDTILLDGQFTAEELEAFAWYMKNKGKREEQV
jgi:hypothetical protein